MYAYKDFKEELQNALPHLHDPLYRPSTAFCQCLGVGQMSTIESVCQVILATIDQLKPDERAHTHAHTRTRAVRIYELLTGRYVRELTQKETARHLNITSRHLRREQQDAIDWLARTLWERGGRNGWTSLQANGDTSSATSNDLALRENDWREQVQQELIVLQQNAPGIVADVGIVMQSLLELASALLAGRDIQLNVTPVEGALTVRLHPSVLRQVLITAVEKLVHELKHGEVTLLAERCGEKIVITICAEPAAPSPPPPSEFIDEILVNQEGAIAITSDAGRVVCAIELPAAGTTTVLVVDDNADLVHFYRRYTEGTRYQIVHHGEGAGVLEQIASTSPDIIVLDVMLPDVDGWQLLIDLRNHALTKSIPIIVCSVVQRQQLALALGATLSITKPVRRHEFIRVLDQVLAA